MHRQKNGATVYIDSHEVRKNTKNNFPYERAVLNGRKAVYPRKKPTLAFQYDGVWVTAKKSKATKPNNFLRKAVADAEKHFVNGVRHRKR